MPWAQWRLGIGAHPFGALAMGALAEALSTSLAVAAMSGLGFLLVLALSVRLGVLGAHGLTSAGVTRPPDRRKCDAQTWTSWARASRR